MSSLSRASSVLTSRFVPGSVPGRLGLADKEGRRQGHNSTITPQSVSNRRNCRVPFAVNQARQLGSRKS